MFTYHDTQTKEQSEESLNTPIKLDLTIEQKAKQFDILMDLIRMKVTEAESQYKLQLLTLAPQYCSCETITNFFLLDMIVIIIQIYKSNLNIFI